jgi:cell division protein FtsL
MKLKKDGRATMELDDFKKKKIKVLDQNGEINQQETDDLMEMVRADFMKQRRISICFVVVLVTLAILYFSGHQKGNQILNSGLILISSGMILGGLYIFLKTRLLTNSIYLLPLTDFLAAAEKRLSYFKLTDWVVVIPLLLLLGTGGGMVFIDRLSRYTDSINLLLIIWIVFFAAISVLGFWAGRKDWKKEHGILLDRVRKLRETLSQETDT